MKTFVHKSILFALIVVGMALSANAQRVIKGTVYREGKPAAGVHVEMHRSSQNMIYTGFDGKYEITGDDKSKWLRFTSVDESKRIDIPDGVTSYDFLFDGVKPADNGDEGGVNLKTVQELVAANDLDFMNNLTMYNEFYKQGDYKSTLVPWRKLYNEYPKSTLNLYHHGINMYESFLEKATSKVEKTMHLDTIMNIYDRRIKYFGQKGFVMGRKGTTWLRYNLPPADDLSNDELMGIYRKGYDMLEVSVQEQGAETEVPVIVLLMQIGRAHV